MITLAREEMKEIEISSERGRVLKLGVEMELEVNLNSFCFFEGFLGIGKTVDVHQN